MKSIRHAVNTAAVFLSFSDVTVLFLISTQTVRPIHPLYQKIASCDHFPNAFNVAILSSSIAATHSSTSISPSIRRTMH